MPVFAPVESETAAGSDWPILSIHHLPRAALPELAGRFGLQVEFVEPEQRIPGSFWGEPEAGVIGATLYLRGDTPLHSALHELSHLICMNTARRTALVRDAGGDDDEECAVCYLQILLADHVAGVGRQRLMQDMNTWGYSFRLGSTERWFEDDADDAAAWLRSHGVLGDHDKVLWSLRHD